jgi:succinoglycan biosynthesis protein ExoM
MKHVSVCVCTYRRPVMLQRLLAEIERQEANGAFTFSVVIADNDVEQSAAAVVEQFTSRATLSVKYCCEPRTNIALARNRALANATGDFIAFIDDDEFPTPTWLARMLAVCESHVVAGVLGPVRPHFESSPPDWLIKGGFHERPEHPTGRVMAWEECRTGNILFRRDILRNVTEPFDPAFGTGGEDKDFFMRMTRQGHVFVWCNEGAVYETVPTERWRRSYLFRRALLRGKNILKHPTGRARMLFTSAVAVPVYSLMLLPCALGGQHYFVKYCIKLCDHLGRLLAFARLNPVSER